MNYNRIKRIIDILVATIAIICLLPLFIIVSVLIKIDSKGSVLFIQKRIGKNNQPFKLIKFRTMHRNAPHHSPTHIAEANQDNITTIGRLLRLTSIDELPQLVNILKGEMSFIGPRPVIWNQTDIIQKRTDLGVHHLYPGITGLAQAKGCDDSVQEEKIYYDKQYLDHFGIIQDTKIVFETIIIMLKRLKRDDDYE